MRTRNKTWAVPDYEEFLMLSQRIPSNKSTRKSKIFTWRVNVTLLQNNKTSLDDFDYLVQVVVTDAHHTLRIHQHNQIQRTVVDTQRNGVVFVNFPIGERGVY